MTVQISFADVYKVFGEGGSETNAIDGLSFEIRQGEFVGYAGPNGAGKSTSIKAMTGVMSVTRGAVRVRGVDPLLKRRELSPNIGVVFGQRSQMIWELSAKAFFDMVKALYRVPTVDFDRRLAYLVGAMDMGSFVDQPIRSLSLGQRMRCELASALLPNPSILYLDEPTIGLDVEARAVMREMLADLNDQYGTTIILTTHDLSDIEALCSRLMIIDHGQLAYDGTIDRLLTEYSPEATVEFHVSANAQLELPGEWRSETSNHGKSVRVIFDRKKSKAAEVIQAVLSQVDVNDLRILEPDVESIIRDIYRSSRSE